MRYPKSIQNLIEQFGKLPTVGPKTAERFVNHLIRQKQEDLEVFASALTELKKGLKNCKLCQCLSEQDPCEICADANRQNNTLCVVASDQDLVSLEQTREYHGCYFVLGGLLNAIEGIRPEDLRLRKLAERVNQLLKLQKDLEIILALSPNLEGETTALYLTKILKNPHIRITRLARGLPTGSNLEYADQLTLGNALKYRNPVQ